MAQTPPTAPALGQVLRNGWLQVRLSNGRIAVTGSRVGNISTSPTSGAYTEKINIRTIDGQAAMTYQRTAPGEKLAIELGPADRLSLRHEPKADSSLTPIEFEQIPGGPVSLTLGSDARAESWHGATLWHLLLAQPQKCRQHLVPLLELFRAEWKLDETADALETELLRLAREGGVPDRRRWAELVAQLADESFARRQAADRQLRALGTSLQSYLEQLDFHRLDAEQQFRLRRILQSLSKETADDAPEQLAVWLAADPAVWLSLLTRPDASTRRLAARQLATLIGEQISFVPDADEITRRKQVDQIRERIAGKKLGPSPPAHGER